MNRTALRTARRFALTLTVAGAAALSSVAIAPAASAAPVEDAPYLIEGSGNGPDALIVTASGRVPVFFCEDVQPGKDGVVDDKDIARAAKKAAEEARKALDEAQRDAKKAAEQADRAAREADKVAYDADKSVRDAAHKAAEEAAKDARHAERAAQEAVDRVMKQHNICLALSAGSSRF